MEQRPMCLETTLPQSELRDKLNNIVLFSDFTNRPLSYCTQNDVTSDLISHVRSTWFRILDGNAAFIDTRDNLIC